jgi:hypothetical protein
MLRAFPATLGQEVTMLRSTASAVLLTCALAGCSADAHMAGLSEGPSFNHVAAPHPMPPPRPIRGDCDVQTIEVAPISPTVIRRVSVGSCQLSHLGRTQLLSVANTNLVTLDQSGEHTFTAANGDLLYATSLGSGSLTAPGTIHFSGVTTISGGSGRFTNATGAMQVEGLSNLAAGSSSFSYDGWISY